jgi:hypothetical protein
MNGDNHIIRTVKDRSNPYVMIARALFDNTRLSIEARGTMGYLLSKPDNWQVRMGDLQRACGVGRDRLRRILKELAAEGYLHRERRHGEAGRWEWVSVVYETPSTENPSMVQPSMVQPPTANTSIYQITSVANSEETITEGSAAATLRDMPRDPLAEHQRLQEFKRRMGM